MHRKTTHRKKSKLEQIRQIHIQSKYPTNNSPQNSSPFTINRKQFSIIYQKFEKLKILPQTVHQNSLTALNLKSRAIHRKQLTTERINSHKKVYPWAIYIGKEKI
jgi:hypothetical protein